MIIDEEFKLSWPAASEQFDQIWLTDNPHNCRHVSIQMLLSHLIGSLKFVTSLLSLAHFVQVEKSTEKKAEITKLSSYFGGVDQKEKLIEKVCF